MVSKPSDYAACVVLKKECYNEMLNTGLEKQWVYLEYPGVDVYKGVANKIFFLKIYYIGISHGVYLFKLSKASG